MTGLRYNAWRKLVRCCVPAGLRRAANRWLGLTIHYEGIYTSWQQASAAAIGYADPAVFERVEQAALAVTEGHGTWEQDGVVFTSDPPALPYASLLAQVAREHGSSLRVIDYGGALGSTYRRIRAFLPETIRLQWHIVEQVHYVERGRNHFASENLHFHDSLEEALNQVAPDVILMSSVLQYVEDPYSLIAKVCLNPVEYLIIDRHPCSESSELITVQVVPSNPYIARYPSWIFDCKRLASELTKSFIQIDGWNSRDLPIKGRGIAASFVGSSWRRREQ